MLVECGNQKNYLWLSLVAKQSEDIMEYIRWKANAIVRL
jgi:hypothetical protein